MIFLTFSFLALDKRSFIHFLCKLDCRSPAKNRAFSENEHFLYYLGVHLGNKRKDGAEIILTKMSANKGQNVNSIFLAILSKLKLMTSFLRLHLGTKIIAII